MKIAVYLTRNRNFRDGVTHYASELLRRVKGDGINCFGAAWLPFGFGREKAELQYKNIFGDLKFVFRKTLLPNRFLSDLCENRIPCVYAGLFNSGANVHVFVNNLIPKNGIKGKKVVVIHDLTPLYDNGGGKKSLRKNYKRYKRTVDVADLIFTDSEFSESEIIKYFPQAKGKTVVNYCGIDYKRFSAPVSDDLKREIKAEYGLNGKYFLFLGQARENKNLKNVIKGYALLPEEIRKEYKLVLANHTRDLIDLAEDAGVKDDIRFLSGIKEEHIVGVLQAAFCVLLISTSEGFGLPMVEAMAAGVPTITSDRSCLPEVAGGAALLVDPCDTVKIKKGMLDIIENGDLRQELIKKGKERAKYFSWEKAAEIFVNKIKELVYADRKDKTNV